MRSSLHLASSGVFGLIVRLACLVSCLAIEQPQFRVIKEWKYVNYTWENEEQLRNAMAGGMYIPEKCIMSGVGYRAGYYYITTPRMYTGTPATLSRVPEQGDTMPDLTPFPSWRRQRLGDCNALQNVQNVQIDADGMLYALDSGRIGTMEAMSSNLCPAKIVKFDLNAPNKEELAKLIYKYEFPSPIVDRDVNFLYDLVLDDNFVYISDNSAQDPGLIVFNETGMSSWKIRHGTFKADPAITSFKVAGTMVNAQLNVAGLGIGPASRSNNGRMLYYTPLSSNQLFAVDTSELQNPTATTLKNVHLIGRKSSQTDGMIMDSNATIYFGLISSSAIARWNTRTPFAPRLIARDQTYIQWPNSFTFNQNGDLVVLASTLAKFIMHRADLSSSNFRLLAGNVSAKSYVESRFKYRETNSNIVTWDQNHGIDYNAPNEFLIDDNDIEPRSAGRVNQAHAFPTSVIILLITTRFL